MRGIALRLELSDTKLKKLPHEGSLYGKYSLVTTIL